MKLIVISVIVTALSKSGRCNCPCCSETFPTITYLSAPAISDNTRDLGPQYETNYAERTVLPIADENVPNLSILKNHLRKKEAKQVPYHIPYTFDKKFSQQRDEIEPVFETRIKQRPALKKRISTLIEPYTTHIPILERYIKPAEESYLKHVPAFQTRIRNRALKSVPLTEFRLQPTLEQSRQIPIKQRFLDNLMEQCSIPLSLPPSSPQYSSSLSAPSSFPAPPFLPCSLPSKFQQLNPFPPCSCGY